MGALPRVYVAPDRWDNEILTLDPEETHHLKDVLRVETGREVLAVDGRGRAATATIEEIGRHHVRLAVQQQQILPPDPVELTLIQALPREQRMDLVVQKATELGAHALIPLVADHSIARPHERDLARKRERWEKIALNALKQSGVRRLPVITEPGPAIDWLQSKPRFDLFLVCSLEPDALPLKEVLRQAGRPATVAALVGPEGDWSGRELAAARMAGARPVSFGASVLRSETAALYILSILRYELL